jgi:hypothetical protein
MPPFIQHNHRLCNWKKNTVKKYLTNFRGKFFFRFKRNLWLRETVFQISIKIIFIIEFVLEPRLIQIEKIEGKTWLSVWEIKLSLNQSFNRSDCFRLNVCIGISPAKLEFELHRKPRNTHKCSRIKLQWYLKTAIYHVLYTIIEAIS